MNLPMNDIDATTSDVDSDINDYAESVMDDKNIDLISNEISLYIESTEKIVESLTNINLIRSSYFVEASSDAVALSDKKTNDTIIGKIKEVIGNTVKKLKSLLNSIFKKGSPVVTYNKIEKIGKEMNQLTLQGIDLGKVKVKLPNVYEYDAHLSNLIDKIIMNITMKSIKEFTIKIKGEPKIDLLRESVDKITKELHNYSIKSNNIKDEIKKMNKLEDRMLDGRSSAETRKTAISTINGNDRKSPSEIATGRMRRQAASKAERDASNAAYNAALQASHEQILRAEENNRMMQMMYDQQMANAHMMMASVENYDCNGRIFTEAILSAMQNPFTVIFLAAIATDITVLLHAIIKELPSVIKSETITVSELYTRAKEISPDKTEKSLNNTLESLRIDLDTKATINNTTSMSNITLEYINKLEKLFLSYVKFKQAEIDYYYKILNEVKTNLLAGNSKKIIVQKESAEIDDDAEVSMEDFMDLDSFVAIN